MDQFKTRGYSDLRTEDYNIMVGYNSQLTPQLQQYNGMGNFSVLVENTNIQNEKRYRIVPMGGSNGYEALYNYKEYAKLNNKSKYYSLADVWNYAQKQPWSEIVVSKRYDGGVVEQVITHN